MMVYDHAMYDINEILGIYVPTINIIGDLSAVLFMLLCGISASISKNSLKHGLSVFAVGCSLTVITGILDDLFHMGLTIQFGILHLMGIALIICTVVKKLPLVWNAVIAACFLFFKKLTAFILFPKNYWLFPFGYYTIGFYSSDYYPIFPFVGIVLTGLFIGRIIYRNKKSILPFPFAGKDLFSFIGRHSLAFYILHQPPLLGILWTITALFRYLGIIH